MTKKVVLLVMSLLALLAVTSCQVAGTEESSSTKEEGNIESSQVYSISADLVNAEIPEGTNLEDVTIEVEATSTDGETEIREFAAGDKIDLELKEAQWSFKIKVLVNDEVIKEGKCELKEKTSHESKEIEWKEPSEEMAAIPVIEVVENIVTITTDVEDAIIYYTTEFGTEPVLYTGPFEVDETVAVVVAFLESAEGEKLGHAKVVINESLLETKKHGSKKEMAAIPVIEVVDNIVTITTDVEDAIIYYTTEFGTEPVLYTEPFEVDETVAVVVAFLESAEGEKLGHAKVVINESLLVQPEA